MHMAIRRPRTFRWTRAHLARLPDDGNRYEVLDGELLVTPQARPSHQIVSVRLTSLLSAYVDAHALGTVVGPGAVVWKKNELQPDVQVIPARIPATTEADWSEFPMPSLVVEILSPGSERHDRYKKRDAYRSLGIPEYWIVDIERTQVQVFRPGIDDAEVVTDIVHWAPRAGLPSLVIDVRKLLGT